MAYDFHYTPTGTGVISGKEVLEQTEDAINDLGNTAISGVQEALDKAEQALTNSENAVDDAQTALNTANNAEGVAIQAQNDVSNLSGTVTNIGNRVTTAEGNISNLQGRMTTAEGNITNLQGRMTTAETNIGNLQTAVSTAQATANSAQQTATTARQQSYVFRYSGTAVVPNSTIAYSTIDNTDNIKSGDKILDVDGKLFEITAVDTTNETVTVGSALIDLAKDSDVVHTSGNETITGTKTFGNGTLIVNNSTGSNVHGEIKLNGSRPGYIVADNVFDGVFDSTGCGVSILLHDFNKPLHIGGYKVDSNGRVFADNTNKKPILSITSNLIQSSTLVPENDTVTTNVFRILSQIDYANGNTSKFLDVRFVQYDNANATSALYSNDDNKTLLGVSSKKWRDVLTYKVNSVEPSSLGMPNVNTSSFVDISGYFTNTGTGEYNTYPVTANGWIFLRLGTISSCQASVLDSNSNLLYGTATSGDIEQILVPVIAGTTFRTQWATASTVTVANARFIPCQGNI